MYDSNPMDQTTSDNSTDVVTATLNQKSRSSILNLMKNWLNYEKVLKMSRKKNPYCTKKQVLNSIL